MKNSIYILLFIFACSVVGTSQGIEFFQGDWEEALVKAKEEDKLIFVDSYTTWCGPCKRMAKNVFPDPEVGKYFNENFVSLKLDMEKPKGRSFGKKYPVSAYPTMFFIASNGEVVSKVKGARKAPDLINVARKAVGGYDRSGEMVDEYEAGNRDYDFMLKYVTELNKAKKESLKISNDYVNSDPDITAEQRALFLAVAANETDSRLFDYMVESKDLIIKSKGEKYFENKVIAAANNSVGKALEFDYYDLVVEAQDKVKNLVGKDRANQFKYKSNILFHKGSGDYSNYIKSVEEFYKKECKKNPEQAKWAIASLLGSFKDQDENKVLASKIAKDLLKKERTLDNEILYTQLLVQIGDHKKALEVVEDSKKKAMKNGEPGEPYDKIIERINKTK